MSYFNKIKNYSYMLVSANTYSDKMILALRLLFLALIIKACTKPCQTQDTVKIIIRQILKEIMKNSYCDVISILHNNVPSIVEESLMLIDWHSYYITNSEIEDRECDGFIVYSESLTELRSAFAKSIQENSDQLLNKKIFVLYGGIKEDKNDLMNLYPKGTRVAFLQVTGDDMSNIWNKKAEMDLSLKLTLGLSGEERILKSASDLNFIEFSLKSWIPQIGRNFRISLFRWRPFVMYQEDSKTFTGAEYDIVREITKDWPVEHKFHRHSSAQGTPGFWAEVVDEVVRGDSDIALGSLWQSVHGRKNVSVTYPFNQFCVTFLVPKPKLLSVVSFTFQPLSLNLWLIIILLFVVTCFLIQLLTYFVQKSAICSQNVPFTDNTTLIFYGIRIFTLGSVKKTIPAALLYLRILFLAFAFACLCLSTAYSAGFTSSLTYPRYEDPIWTVSDMIKQNIKLSFRRSSGGTVVLSLLENSANPAVRSLANTLASNDSDDYSNAMITQDLGRRYITGTDNLDDYLKTHCQVLKECIQRENIVLVMQKNSPFLSFFNKQIQRYIEHGFVDYWHNRALSQSNMTFMSNFYTVYAEDYHAKPLNIEKLQGAFYLLIVGLLSGFIVFLMELVY